MPTLEDALYQGNMAYFKMYMLWFSFLLGSAFISLRSRLLASGMIHTSCRKVCKCDTSLMCASSNRLHPMSEFLLCRLNPLFQTYCYHAIPKIKKQKLKLNHNIYTYCVCVSITQGICRLKQMSSMASVRLYFSSLH